MAYSKQQTEFVQPVDTTSGKYATRVRYEVIYGFYESFTPVHIIINNYSTKWRWLAVDIYRAAKRRGKYPTLATDTEVDSCFSVY